MAEAAIHTIPTEQRPPLVVIPGGGGPPSAPRPAAVANPILGIAVVIAFEIMMFAGLLGTYLMLRTASVTWPPPGLPHLPLVVTWINTGVLLFSAYTMRKSYAALRAGDDDGFRSALLWSAVLGVGFLAIQGSEWVRLIGQGLVWTEHVYAGAFYVLIGFHAMHVASAVLWLAVVYGLARRRRFSAEHYVPVQVCAIYWYFVCALWVVLFGAVYLY